MTDGGSRRYPWSARTAWDLAETPWARQLARLRAAGAQLCDLTAANPTHCGFTYDAAAILAPLSDPGALYYDPDPRGLRPAREAVCRYYQDHGALVAPEQIFLTTGTSEAYSFLFRLLCDPGDEVLIGQPGYPLFDFLARLDDVGLVPYELFYDHGWHLDLEALRRRVTPHTRAIMVVNPNNPTGHFTGRAEREALEALCREQGLALIVDEVFLDYGLTHRGAELRYREPSGTHLCIERPQQSGWAATDEGRLDRMLRCRGGHGSPGSDLRHFPFLERPHSVGTAWMAEPACNAAGANQGASQGEPCHSGRHSFAAESGDPAGCRGRVVCRASGSRAAA